MMSLKLTAAVILAVVALGVWLVFLRPVPIQTGVGTITSKGHRDATTYQQQQPGADRGFRTPNAIPIAESDVVEIQLDGVAAPVRASLNMVETRALPVGQRVSVRYQRRGVPLLWQRVYVLDVHADSSAQAPAR